MSRGGGGLVCDCNIAGLMCQSPSGYRKCFEVYYWLFKAGSEGLASYSIVKAGGGIIAPHCTEVEGWSRRRAIYIMGQGVKCYPACLPGCVRSFIRLRD